MANDERDADSGKFTTKHAAEDFLEAIAEHGGAATTSEVVDATGKKKRTVQYWLGKLRDDGRLDVREVGGAYLWQLADDVDGDSGDPPGREAPPATADDRRDQSVADEPPAADADVSAPTDDAPADPDVEAAASVDYPATQDPEACVDAVLAARDHIREQGGATKGELVHAVMPAHPLGYDVDGALEKVDTEGVRFRGAWWRSVVKEGLEAIDAVEKPGRGGSEWTYVGDGSSGGDDE